MKEVKGLLRVLPQSTAEKTGWPWTEECDPEVYKDINYFPKISIITPSYNQGKYIEQTIRSVLLQNYPNLEYLVMDGGSSDNTVETIKKYEPWIKYWVSEKDKGQSHAINKGVLKCEGDIFNWLNSDDYYNKGCFKILASNFDKNDTHVLAGNYRFFFDNNNQKERTVNFRLMNSLEETLAYVLVNQPSTFYNLDIFKSLGKLDERLNFLMDQDIWKKYLFKYGQEKIKILDMDLTNFRFHETSKTYLYKFNNEYVNIFYSIANKAGMKKHTAFLKKVYSEEIGKGYDFKYKFSNENIELAKRVINNLVFFMARNAFSSNDMKLLNLSLGVLETKWLNENQKDSTFILKIKSKLKKYKLNPVLKLITKRNNRKISNFAKRKSNR